MAVRCAGAGATDGSAAPPGANLAVHNSGAYLLGVRWTDGVEKEFKPDLGGKKTQRLTCGR